MLVTDYQRRLGSLIQGVQNRILLPDGMQDFFNESGPTSPLPSDRRTSVRTRVRTRGVLFPRCWLPAFPRSPEPQAIFTKDFSKTGFGFLAHEQYFPGEQVRVLLATFWMEISIRRCRRLGPECFELGGMLIHRHDASLRAFPDHHTEPATTN